MKLPNTARLLPWWRLVRIPVILVVLYLALHPVLAALSQRHGYGSPDGMGAAYLTVTVTLVALRIVLLVVVPAVLTYRVVAWAITDILRRIGPPTPPSGAAASNIHERSEQNAST